MIGPKPKGLTHCGCSPWQMIKEQIQSLYERVTVTEQRCNTLQAEIDEIEVGPADHTLFIISFNEPIPGDNICVWDGEQMTLEKASRYIYDAVYARTETITLIISSTMGRTLYHTLSMVRDQRLESTSTTVQFSRVSVDGKTSVDEHLVTIVIEGNDLSLKHVTSLQEGYNSYPE